MGRCHAIYEFLNLIGGDCESIRQLACHLAIPMWNVQRRRDRWHNPERDASSIKGTDRLNRGSLRNISQLDITSELFNVQVIYGGAPEVMLDFRMFRWNYSDICNNFNRAHPLSFPQNHKSISVVMNTRDGRVVVYSTWCTDLYKFAIRWLEAIWNCGP